ncbi:hypothetical protein GYMLUDRAFT_160335 [Collybiopsis luxurians FD-317 M1]|nr:hypothetical protein GYMLUDRAFT_160335 [Collybiopsis luxurians FD-317 M1]
MDVDGELQTQDSVDIDLKANQLVRLALFQEHRRMPLRRDDISKKVFGPSNSRVARSFNRVFERAQLILNRTFGMELVELQSRAVMDKAAAAAADPSIADEEEDEEPAATQGKKKKAPPTGSKTYILRSILDPNIISFASLPDEEILNAELDDAPADDDNDDEGTPAPTRTQGRRRSESSSNSFASSNCSGTILSFSSSTLPGLENPGALGILYVVLSLILVSGRLMGDRDLRSALRQLHLPAGASIPLGRSAHNASGSGGGNSMTIENYLQQLIRQGYIDRIVVGEAGKAPKAAGGKRGRSSTAAGNLDRGDDPNGEGTKYEWRWGTRAQSEIGEKAVAEFIAEFMAGDLEATGGDGQDNEAGGSRKRGRKARGSGTNNSQGNTVTKLKKMMDGVEKAAGGNLADLK